MKHATAKRYRTTPRRSPEQTRIDRTNADSTVAGSTNADRPRMGDERRNAVSPAPGKVLDHPVLDGAIEDPRIEHGVENPWRGIDDPGLVVHPGRKRRRGWHWFWE